MVASYFQGLFILLTLIFCSSSALASDKSMSIAGYPEEEALRLGEKMYREGILPSGKSMRATVMGDIPVDGRIFTCDDCHQRSGLGSVEGTVITWPTNGKELYRPRRRTGAYRPPADSLQQGEGRSSLPIHYQIEDARPAYTDNSLARLLRSGVDSAGKKLDPIMPRFRMSKGNMDVLIHYLKNLSVQLSPGVDKTTIHFATVIGPDVPKRERQAMLLTLQTHMDAHNSQTRNQERRSAFGPFYKTEKHQAYRRLDLAVWELHGPEETWREQLEEYYRRQPVFALLGGISTGGWQPVHSFSEERRVPCIFPLTDLPVISATDWYTLYFSKGYYQEGESAARYLRTHAKGGLNSSIIQVFRRNKQAMAMAAGFRETWEKIGGNAPEELILEGADPVTAQLLQGKTDSSGNSVFLLWLDRGDESVLRTVGTQARPDATIFTSATLLQNDFSGIAEDLRQVVHITYPYSLPEEVGKKDFVVSRWLQIRKIPQTDFTMQAKMYFLGWMLPGALKYMRSEFFRDYFVEGFDMMTDQDYAIAVYPRLTFGPGQRYASKGCYIVKLGKGPNPTLLPVSDWVSY